MRNNPSGAVEIVCRVALAAMLFLSAGARLVRAEVVLYLNPYEGVQWDQFEQSKTNLHTHTTESDGAMSPATVIDEYRSRDYGVLALTDHNLSTYPWEDFGRDPNALGMVAIAGNELSRHHHTLSLFSNYTTTTTDWDTAIAGVGAAGGLAVISHPAMHWVSWSYPAGPDEGNVPDSVVERYAELYRTYPHLLGTEVSNGTRPLGEYPLDRELWDDLLMKLMPERPVWGFAVDDMHSMTHMGRDWITVVTPELSEAAVREAMTRGAFFPSTIRLHASGEQSVDATPVVQGVDHDAAQGVITLSATHAGATLPDDAYQWIADGKTVHVGPTLDYRNTPGINTYVRAEITGSGGTTFTNPFGFMSPSERVVTGLVGYWNFHDELTSNMIDGGPNAAVLSGDPVSGVRDGESGFVGKAMVLDGSSGIQLPLGTEELGDSFAVGAWYWQAPDPTDRNFVFEASDSYDVSYGTNGANNTFVSYVGQVNAGSVQTDSGQWHHVLHSFDTAWNETLQRLDTTLSVYVDGTLQGAPTTVDAGSVDFASINMGTYRDADNRFLDGMIDDVALWNRSLSGLEAQTIYNMGQDGYALMPVTRVKANNTENLNVGASWQSGIVPDDSAHMVFDATFARTDALDTGGSLSVGGIRVTDGAGPIHVNNTNPDHYLQVGKMGVDMADAQRNLTVENLRLGADQVWNVATGRDFTVGTLSGDHSVTKTGEGTVVLAGANTHTGGTTIEGGTLLARSDGALGDGAVTLASGSLHVERSATLSNDIVLDGAAEANFIRATVAVDYLVVGGGGGGGGRDSSGGGGGGGVVSNLVEPGLGTVLDLVSGSNDVVVGGGGAGGENTTRGANGQASSIGSIVALGGGAGGPYSSPAAPGASGGGAGRQSTPGAGTEGQGFDGGNGTGGGDSAVDTGGGGGGAGGLGGDGITSVAGGDGGVGLAVDITGSAVYYGGGGGGAPHRLATTLLGGLGGDGGGGDSAPAYSVAPSPGGENTGGGGGASRSAPGYMGATPDLYTGGSGGSGTVVVRYPGDPMATGGIITAGTGSAAGYTIHTFTQVGAHTLEFDPIDLTISGTMRGTGGFTWDSSGVLTLSGANTHGGQTRVTAGTLALGNPQAVQNSTLSLDGGGVAFTAPGASSYTLGGLAGTADVDAGAYSLVVGGNHQSTIYAGNLTATRLTKTGNGTLSLSGSNTLGGTTISGGALVAPYEGALGDGAVTLAGGTLYTGAGLTNEIILDGAAANNFIRAAVAMDYLVVGGGGGGGGRDVSGGGGGGGVLTNLGDSDLSPVVAMGDSVYDVTIGGGGAGGDYSLSGGTIGSGTNGQASSFGDVTALGGGGGGAYNSTGRDGASGGGGGRQGPTGGDGTSGQGFDGGAGTGGGDVAVDTGGGGGGAGGAGGDGVATVKGGDGGVGLAVDIAGEEVFYGGGGGGTPHRSAPTAMLGGDGGLGGGGAGLDVAHQTANPGQPNSGGGGGASRSDNETLGIGGSGGSGVVVVRYRGDPVATGGAITAGTGSAAGYTIHTFTDIGTHTFEVRNAMLSATMSGSGGFTWDTPGVLTLTAANTYTGETRITAGTLALVGTGSIAQSNTILVGADGTLDVTGASGGFSLADGQTLAGSGTVLGNVTIDAGSLVAPGDDNHGPGSLEVVGDYGQSGDLEIEILGSDLDDFDRLTVSGSAALGGTIEVTLLDAAWFDVGDTFAVLTASYVSGEFSEILLPTLLGEPVFALDCSDTDVTLTALRTVAAKLLGDANRDGTVDVSDLGILATYYDTGGGHGWEHADFTGDGFVDVSDLGILATYYGETAPAARVPEPGTLTLLATCGLALLVLCVRRRKR